MMRTVAKMELSQNVRTALAALSGLFFAFSYPQISFGWLGWFALVPLMGALRRAESKSEAVGLGLIAGVLSNGFLLFWLTRVTAVGWAILVMLETAFFLLYVLWFYSLRGRLGGSAECFAAAAGWTVCEWLRTEIPIFGFGWNLLAHTQTDHPWILQSASAVGVYGLGFLMALTNACFYRIVFPEPDPSGKVSIFRSKDWWRGFVVTVMLAAIIFAGRDRYESVHKTLKPKLLNISLIQGNIPQEIKWVSIAREKIIDIYLSLTKLASYQKPDLVIWPEAAFPGYFNHDPEAIPVWDFARQIDTPILVGSPHFENYEVAYNSAYLIGRDGHPAGRYDKLNLVPFGEYVPLKPVLGWLEPYAETLGVSDFSRGKNWEVFRLQNGELPFSVLICFEDVFPSMARRFVGLGAQFLVIITNDAWFGPTAAPYQHLQASIFRAVENGVTVVRAANTGVSAFINQTGDVLDRVRGDSGADIFVAGQKTLSVNVDKFETTYRRFGWIFPYLAIASFVIINAGLWLTRPSHSRV